MHIEQPPDAQRRIGRPLAERRQDEVLADAESRLEGDAREARLLRTALESKQMTVGRAPDR